MPEVTVREPDPTTPRRSVRCGRPRLPLTGPLRRPGSGRHAPRTPCSDGAAGSASSTTWWWGRRPRGGPVRTRASSAVEVHPEHGSRGVGTALLRRGGRRLPRRPRAVRGLLRRPDRPGLRGAPRVPADGEHQVSGVDPATVPARRVCRRPGCPRPAGHARRPRPAAGDPQPRAPPTTRAGSAASTPARQFLAGLVGQPGQRPRAVLGAAGPDGRRAGGGGVHQRPGGPARHRAWSGDDGDPPRPPRPRAGPVGQAEDAQRAWPPRVSPRPSPPTTPRTSRCSRSTTPSATGPRPDDPVQRRLIH